MDTPYDGGPAHPVPLEDWRDADTHPLQGMSLRDKFAEAALIGLTSHSTHSNTVIVDRAWTLADLMLVARERKEGTWNAPNP